MSVYVLVSIYLSNSYPLRAQRQAYATMPATHFLHLLLLATPLTHGQSTSSSIPSISTSSPSLPCGVQGGPCCRPSFGTDPALGQVVKCNEGLGCDVRTRMCVSPCGTPGGPCCDGPETRAPAWNSSGSIYTPTDPLLKEMCNTGTCDKPSHRCVACSSGIGTACCPPPAGSRYATCTSDHLRCFFDTATSGTCRRCGTLNNPSCDCTRGNQNPNCVACDKPLETFISDVCEQCGGGGQRRCFDSYNCNDGCKPYFFYDFVQCVPCGGVGERYCPSPRTTSTACADWSRCKPGLGIIKDYCQECGAEAKVPCDDGCGQGLKLKRGYCTVLCGHANEQPCDDGKCASQTQLTQGVCKPCGVAQAPPCPFPTVPCISSLRVRQGLCTACGAVSQLPCDLGCDSGLLPDYGFCSSTCGWEGIPPCDDGCRRGFVVGPQNLCEPPRV